MMTIKYFGANLGEKGSFKVEQIKCDGSVVILLGDGDLDRARAVGVIHLAPGEHVCKNLKDVVSI